MTPPVKHEDLTAENSAAKVIRSALSIAEPKKPLIVSAAVFVLVFFLLFFQEYNLEKLTTFTTDYFKLGFQISLNVVSLFMAGFSVFSSQVKEKLLVAMASVKKQNSEHAFIKHNALTFVSTFIFFLGFAALCLASFLTTFLITPLDESKRYAVLTFLLSVVSTGFAFVLMELLTMIYNIYHAYMTSARWLIENSKDEDKK